MSDIVLGGISEVNRLRLQQLHRQLTAPFTVEAAMPVLGLGRSATQRLLAYLAAQGWLVRVAHGLYAPVPLETAQPERWQVEPWAVAMERFAPCYIGGWSAASHWELTEQIFRTVVVLSAAAKLRDRHPVIQGTEYWVKRIGADQLFGVRAVWVERRRIAVSDPSRTVVDLLDDPRLGGGMRHIAEIVHTYVMSDHRRDRLLLDYAERVGNGAVYKRLGYLVERLGIDAPELVAVCQARLTTGYALLDPTMPATGRLQRRWRLRINSTLPRVSS
jgi:predicted transcriptional regulator of viral defense system